MRTLAAVLLLVSGAQGCAAHACTDVGGISGINVTIPRSLYLASETAVVQLCDDSGCTRTTKQLPRQSPQADSHGILVPDAALGRRPASGQVRVTVTLTDAGGRQLAIAHRDVPLVRYYPNGKACDGDGYLHGSLHLTKRDRLSR